LVLRLLNTGDGGNTMRTSAMVFILIAVTAGGCTRASDHCQGKSAADCNADANCVALGCPGCNGQSSFSGCYDKNGPLPGFACPAIACADCYGLDEAACTAAASRGCHAVSCCGTFSQCAPPNDPGSCPAIACTNCSGLDEATCSQRSDCRVDRCPTCNGGQGSFVGCSQPTDPPPPCAQPSCMPSCDQLDAQSCAARTDCHAVFEPGQACGCATPGCCTLFSHCAYGAPACTGTVTCMTTPPTCEGDYTLGYQNGCYEGCVLKSACH
jgi:hypothetical protein